MIQVSRVVREKARAAGATQWLDELAQLVAALEAEWQLSVGHPLSGGTESYVAEAVCHDGTRAVLKLLVPRDADAAAHEITALRLAGGRGCARLLRADAGRGALLLEHLGRPLSALDLPARRRQTILAAAAGEVWRPAGGSGLPTGAAKARDLAAFISSSWEELGRPCSRLAIEYALTCAERRADAHRDDAAVLVHGDVHQWNALEAGEEFKLVDPDGLLAEPEYDLGIIMREDPGEGDLRERARGLARETQLNEEAIWEWGVVERVSTGLLATRVGLQPVGREMLAAADEVAAVTRRPRSATRPSTSSSRRPSA